MYEIEYIEIEENKGNEELIKTVVETCFNEENLQKTKLYVEIILTNSKQIQQINKEHRKIDKETDVLSFPMFEKEEIKELINNSYQQDILGNIVISIPKVEEQAQEYEHSFKRELAYMIVHGFYHLMGYDHMEEKEKQEMRRKEEKILEKINITRS